jgi:type IV pilus assembly protein PilA
MHDIINRLRAKKGDEGFTLIELLVVVVIIGVLVAIAVPVYLNYRKGAADKSAQSDARGAVSAVEQFYTDNGNKYPDTKAADNTSGSGDTHEWIDLTITGSATATSQRITVSDKTLLGYNNKGDGTYVICAHNAGGTTARWYVYNSANGGSVKASTVANPSVTTC